MSVNVLGLDLSIAATGVALPTGGKTFTINGDAKHGDQRLCMIVDAIHDVVRWYDRIHLAVLEGFVTRSPAASTLGMVHGSVRRYLMCMNIPYVLIPPATLKAYATGHGKADKTAMAMAAFKRAGQEFGDDNQCDAWWARDAGRRHLGAHDFDLPAVQRDRLSKVEWPNLAATLDHLET